MPGNPSGDNTKSEKKEKKKAAIRYQAQMIHDTTQGNQTYLPTDSLLSVTTGELVSNDWVSLK